MRWEPRLWMPLAALSGGLSVAMGAFAAHGVRDTRAQDLLRTGATYEMVHALAVLACGALMQAGLRRMRHPPAFFLAGALIFSGSLYAMALGGPRLLGAATPVGGLLFIAGWAVMAWNLWKEPQKA